MQIDESVLETIQANKTEASAGSGSISDYVSEIERSSDYQSFSSTSTYSPNYQQGCSFRLPCGICTKTNSIYPTWTVSTGTSTPTAEELKKYHNVTNMCEVKP